MKTKLIALILTAHILLCQFAFAQSDRGVGNRQTQKRIALVIGNGAYQKTSELPNPTNDAADMKATLEALGFEVIYGVDQDARQMKVLIRQFGDRLNETKAVGLVFYAGHGVAANGENYLVPVDADIPREDEIEGATIPLSFLMGKLDAAKNPLNIVILDACRNNPFARSWGAMRDISSNGGLVSPKQAPSGTLIAYATAPGSTASDGTGRNGLYTQELLAQMRQPNQKIEEVFKNVRIQVKQKSNQKQTPWELSSLDGDFYFAEKVGGVRPDSETDSNLSVSKDPRTVENDAWNLVRNSAEAQDFREFLREFPAGTHAGTSRMRLEQIIWESVRSSADASLVKTYLDEFPDGANAPSGRILLSQLTRSKVQPVPEPVPVSDKSASDSTSGSGGNVTTNSIGMSFVRIPGKSFLFSKFKVTQAEWTAVMGKNPSKFSDCPRCPVENVDWNDVQNFIKKLNARDGGRYRLPTAEEWEYAEKGGKTTTYHWGNSADDAKAYVWYNSNSENRPHEVGLKKPNAYGLFDMQGNVMEWCEAVICGAAFDMVSPYFLNDGRRATWGRKAIKPSHRGYYLGFRLIKE